MEWIGKYSFAIVIIIALFVTAGYTFKNKININNRYAKEINAASTPVTIMNGKAANNLSSEDEDYTETSTGNSISGSSPSQAGTTQGSYEQNTGTSSQKNTSEGNSAQTGSTKTQRNTQSQQSTAGSSGTFNQNGKIRGSQQGSSTVLNGM